jgi:hypothetical protein
LIVQEVLVSGRPIRTLAANTSSHFAGENDRLGCYVVVVVVVVVGGNVDST